MKAICITSVAVFCIILFFFILSLFDIIEIQPELRGLAGIAAILSLGISVKSLKRLRRHTSRH